MESGQKHIKVTILGSGTSTGVPVIGCDCRICLSASGRNIRLRTSILLQTGKKNLIVDTGPDFRQQALRENLKQVDEIFYTHVHADHSHGIDELRAFFFGGGQDIPCWISKIHFAELSRRFDYLFSENSYGGVTAKFIPQVMKDKDRISLLGYDAEVVFLPHGHTFSVGFRLGRFAYATDFKAFPKSAIDRWRGKIDTMIASGIHFREHSAHSTVPETIQLFQSLGVKKGFITHLSHEIDAKRDQARLPDHVHFAYDGQKISVALD